MPRGKYPRKVSWKQVSSQLRDLQDRVSRYQGHCFDPAFLSSRFCRSSVDREMVRGNTTSRAFSVRLRGSRLSVRIPRSRADVLRLQAEIAKDDRCVVGEGFQSSLFHRS